MSFTVRGAWQTACKIRSRIGSPSILNRAATDIISRMNGKNVRRYGKPDDRVVEITGFLKPGMHQDALSKTRAVLSQEQLSVDEFSEAVWVVLIAEGECKLWENPVKAAYDRLSESDQMKAGGTEVIASFFRLYLASTTLPTPKTLSHTVGH